MQNQFFLHQYWKFMHFSPYMPLARRPSLFSIVALKINRLYGSLAINGSNS